MLAKSIYHVCVAFVLWMCSMCAHDDITLKNMAQSDAPMQIVIDAEIDSYDSIEQKIGACFAKELCVDAISYDSDVCLQKAEFDYLIGIKPGDSIVAQDLCVGIRYFIKKRKFKTITIVLTPAVSGCTLHLSFISFWTFEQVVFQGIFVGKECYRQFYAMEYGQKFEQSVHDHSVLAMQESLHKDGYFQAKISSSFEYHQATKSVTVKLAIKKGPRFSIGGASVSVVSPLTSKEQKKVERMIHKQLMRLRRTHYERDAIESEIASLKELLAKKGYIHADIQMQESTCFKSRRVFLTCVVHIHEKKRFIFCNNSFFSDDQLFQTILMFGSSASLLPASIISEELIKAYHERGFWDVSITCDEGDDACRFVIDEGSRARIGAIALRNLEAFDQALLIKKFFSSVMRKRFYNASDVSQATERLVDYLIKQGFWQARFITELFEPLDGKQLYKMILVFDQGPCSFLKKVTIDQFPEWEAEGPFKVLQKDGKPMPCHADMLDEQRQWLLHKLQPHGITHVTPEYVREGDGIHINWLTNKKERESSLDKTVVLASTTFPFSYVQRELAYEIGDSWHSDVLRNSVSRLKRLEVFDAVSLTPDYEGSLTERVLLLKLRKDDPYEVRIRSGLGVQHVTKSLTTDGATYRIGGSFLYKNPCNVGDQFSCAADFTRAIRLAHVQYRRPWIGGLPITGLFKGYTNRFEYPGFIGSQKNLYTVIQQGFLMNFNSVRDHIDAAISTGFEVVDTFIDEKTVEDVAFAHEVARAINFRPDLLDKNIPFFQLESTMMLYFLDNTVNPTRGAFSVFSTKGMFPVAKLDPGDFFIRILAEQSFFIPLLPLVVAIRCRVGHIFHQKFSTILPIERFYLGGANSIRSYETDQCPPLGAVCDNEGKELFVPQGGRSLANMNIEARFPLYKQLGGVVFGDIGALSINNLTDIKADDMLSGVGFGLRYNTPIGPLRFDIAWRVHKHDGVGRPYAWFLSFGNAFI